MSNTFEAQDKAQRKVARLGEDAGRQFSKQAAGEASYQVEKFHGRQGHGFAAEQMETQEDYLAGRDAKIVGSDNAKNGADRVVNGQLIQTKYCRSGQACVDACFDEHGFRYYASDGKPMQIEVPQDMYESAVRALEKRIAAGDVKGVRNPAAAQQIIRRGTYTYEQAVAAARPGTIESLVFDAKNGMVIARSAMGISAVLTFALAIWNGDSKTTALKKAALVSVRVGGLTMATTVISSQMARFGKNELLVKGADMVTRQIGREATAQAGKGLTTGTNLMQEGAAFRNAAQLLRQNVLTSVVTVALLSAGDVVRLFNGRISKGQLLKNVLFTASTVAGGTAGWLAGTVALNVFLPGAGTIITGLVALTGSIAGTVASAKVAGAVLDKTIQDDAAAMLAILDQALDEALRDNFLTENETEELFGEIEADLSAEALQDMYSSGNPQQWANRFVRERVREVLEERDVIALWDEQEWQAAMQGALTDMSAFSTFAAKDRKQGFTAEQKRILKAEYGLQDFQITKVYRQLAKQDHLGRRNIHLAERLGREEIGYQQQHRQQTEEIERNFQRIKEELQ